MKIRKFPLAITAALAAIPFGYYGLRAAAFRAHAENPPAMVPSTIVFSEIVSAGKPAQHAIRVIAHREDHSISDTYYYTHNIGEQAAASADGLPQNFDRHMQLFRPDGFFKIEVYTRFGAKVTFPAVLELGRRMVLSSMSPEDDCLRNYAGRSALGNDTYVGKQKIVLPGLGIVDAVMTHLERPDLDLVSWYAPSLGCAEVQHIATFPTKDGSVSVNAMYPVSITMGEPKPELFSDAGATETEPAEVARRNRRASGLASNLPEAEIRATEAKAAASSAVRLKQARYVQAWTLFRAGKMRP